MPGLIGANTVRTDGMVKATGEAVFTVDYAEPGMLHGRLLRSPVAAGQILKLDTSKALAMPGVKAIIAHKDVQGGLVGLILKDRGLFADKVVRFVGEPIAAVAADTLVHAQAAVDVIEIEIEETRAVGDVHSALAADAPLVHPDFDSYELNYTPPGGLGGSGNVANEVVMAPDGVDEIFRQAAYVIEDEFETGRQYQAYLEPKAAVAVYRDGRYTIHTGNQWPFGVRGEVAGLLGVRPSAVRVINHTVGGGFGSKLEFGMEPYAAALSKAAGGRAVKIVNTRSEDMLTANARENSHIKIRTALDSNGVILARDIDVLQDLGAYATETILSPSVAIPLAGGVYRVGATRVRARGVYTNTPPTGCYRGVPGPYLYNAVEQHMDHIAKELGFDRREYRLRHLIDDGELMPNGQTLADAGIVREGFASVEACAPWREVSRNGAAFRGVGLVAGWWLTATGTGTATVRVNEDGTAQLVTAANENGSGAVAMGLSQIVADGLGIDVSDVIVPLVDTDNCGWEGGSQGSRTTTMTGRAVKDAVDEVRTKIELAAADLLEAATDDIEITNAGVGIVGAPHTRISLANIATRAMLSGRELCATGSFAGPPAELKEPGGCVPNMIVPGITVPNYHVHFAEVEVDPVTGNVSVVRYVVAQEVGKVINPAGVIGQIQGAVTQGIGYALYESMRIEGCRHVECTFEAYRLPLSVDIPRVETILMEHPWEGGPHGAKGAAEPAILLPAAAIGNAVADAIGRTQPFKKIPITPEDVLAAIEELERMRAA